MLEGADLAHNVFIQALAGIQNGFHIVLEAVLVVILRSQYIVSVFFAHFFSSLSSSISFIAFQPMVAHLMRLACLCTFFIATASSRREGS